MIEFVTLILGLIIGQQTVELSVGDEVTTVEILLDGHTLGTIIEEPWAMNCDFGEELAPHELVAIARDESGRELARARQLINLPRPRAEARFVLEPGQGRAPPFARLVWQALDYERPEKVYLSFDGRRLNARNLEHIELPAHDPESIHFLAARLVFSDRVATHAELAFGGRFGDEVSTELTAVMITADDRRPKPEQMAGWFLKDGRPLRVVAVEKEPIDLLMVRENSTTTILGLQDLPKIRVSGRTHRLKGRRGGMRLAGRDQWRVVFPFARQQAKTELETYMLPVSIDVADYADGSLVKFLTRFNFPEEKEMRPPRQRIAEAVAVAGLVAAAGNHRRAVVLIYSGEAADVSQFRPEIVRRYLRRLGVPLLVWALPVEEEVYPSAWGEERHLSTLRDLEVAIGELGKLLRPQLTVWVEGAHLPGEIELSERATGIRLLE